MRRANGKPGCRRMENGCVADLRQRPPQVTRAHSLPHLGCLTYSAENGLYAASRAAGSGTIGRALLSKNPATLNWAEPSPIGYDGPPQTLCWADHSLWVGDPTNATRIELTDRGTCQDVKTGLCRKMDGAPNTIAALRQTVWAGSTFPTSGTRGRFTAGKTAR